jgi:hypothetical protein
MNKQFKSFKFDASLSTMVLPTVPCAALPKLKENVKYCSLLLLLLLPTENMKPH